MLEIGQRLAIKGDWDTTPVADGRIAILLKPSFAFGPSHPSSQIFLGELESLVWAGMNVLDIGTGPGTFAIAAVKLGAGSAVGTDINAESIKAAEANVAVNGLENGIKIVKLDSPPKGKFDLVLCNIDDVNILGDVLTKSNVNPNGYVAIMPESKDLTALEAQGLVAGLTKVKTIPVGNWVYMLFQKV